jgi:glycosyltransferase involved in cell wall biosynthesis
MNRKFLIIPKIYKSGGTRQYLVYLADYFRSVSADARFVISKTYFDDELKKLFDYNGFKYSIINEYPAVENIFDDLKLISLYRSLLNFKKYFLYLFYKLKYSPDNIVFSEWNLVWDFIFLLIPGKKTFIVHSYPLRILCPCISTLIKKMFITENVKIVTVSSFSKSRINEYWFNGKDTALAVPNFSKYDSIISEQCTYKNNYIVLTVGHLVPYKNPDLWLKTAEAVLRRNPDKKIIFKWIGEGRLYEHYKKFETENIIFTGDLDDLIPEYTSASVYFQPSILESQGMAVLEAMNLGLPCVVSDQGGLKESVINGENGYMFSLSDPADKIAELLERVMFEENLWNKFSSQGIKVYRDKFSKSRWQDQMNSLFGINNAE